MPKITVKPDPEAKASPSKPSAAPSATSVSERPSGTSMLSEAPSGTSMLSEQPSGTSMLSERPSGTSMLSAQPSATSMASSRGSEASKASAAKTKRPFRWLCCCGNITGAFVCGIVQLVLACLAFSFACQSAYETWVARHPNFLNDIVRYSGVIAAAGALLMVISPSVLFRMLRFARSDFFKWWLILTYIGFGLYFLASIIDLVQSMSMISRYATLTGLVPNALLLVFLTLLNIGARNEVEWKLDQQEAAVAAATASAVPTEADDASRSKLGSQSNLSDSDYEE